MIQEVVTEKAEKVRSNRGSSNISPMNAEGYREILGICEGAKEDRSGWSGFLKHLKERGLKGVQLIISDACIGLAKARADPDQFQMGCRQAGWRGIGPARR